MKRNHIGLFFALSFILFSSAFAYDKPFKIGKGRYLTADEIKSLKEDIAKNGSPDFKKDYDKAYREQSAQGDNKAVRFIRFVKLEPGFGPPPRERKEKPLYLAIFAGTEDVPQKEPVKITNVKGDYDIWVIGGAQYLMFDRDMKTSRYNFLESGAAE